MFYYNIMLVVRAEIDFCILQNPRSNGCQSNTKKRELHTFNNQSDGSFMVDWYWLIDN